MRNDAEHRIRTVMQAIVVCIVVLLLTGFCFSQPSISLAPASGPPTTSLRVSGSGFAPYAKIDIYFDTTDGALAVANGSGSFSQIAVVAPVSARPGKHWVSAVQRSGQIGAQTPFSIQTAWSQFHRHNMIRRNWYENVLGVDNVANLQLKWSYDVGFTSSSPVVQDGVVYTGTYNGLLYAFDASTGAVLWTYQTASGGASYASPAINNKKVYYGSLDGNVYALNASTGAKVWSYLTGGAVYSSPTVISGVAYIGSNDGNLYALNSSTGALLWKYATGGAVASTPAVADGVVYFGSNDGNAYALNASSGAKLWSYYVGGNYTPDLFTQSPAVDNGLVYVGSGDADYLYALNASTGAKVWSQYIGSGFTPISSPAIALGVLYIGSGDGNLYALNDKTGAVLWTYNTYNRVGTSPAVANGVVYFGTNNWILYAADAITGAILWQYDTTSVTDCSPVIADGVLYFCAGNTTFFTFGLPESAAEVAADAATAKAPSLKTLQPDFTLKVSQPTAAAAVVGEGL